MNDAGTDTESTERPRGGGTGALRGQPAVAQPVALLPPPPLDERQLRADSAVVAGFGRLEALVPAAEPYVCSDAKAPVLLLVPGLGMDGLCFIRQLQLGALAHIHLFQMPNAPVPGEEGLCGFARYVEEYVFERKLDQRPGGLILGGASMGGAISMLMALRGRVQVRALVLLCTYGSSRHLPLLQRVLAPLAYIVPLAFLRRCGWLLTPYLPHNNITRAEARWLAYPGIKRTLSYYGYAVGALARLELIERVRQLSLPTLIVHGAADNVLPPAAAVELQRSIPGASLVLVPNARHAFFFRHYEQVNPAIASFIADVRGK